MRKTACTSVGVRSNMLVILHPHCGLLHACMTPATPCDLDGAALLLPFVTCRSEEVV